MTCIDVLMKIHGWSLMSVPARYTASREGEIIIGLAHSEEQVYNLLDCYTDGGDTCNAIENYEYGVPGSPVARAANFFAALEALEKKLEAVGLNRLNDHQWRTEMTLKLQEFLDIAKG